MKILILTLTLSLFNNNDKVYRNDDWSIKIDLSKTKIIVDTYIGHDSILNSDFSKFVLPKVYCPEENIEFQPVIRIFNKYLSADTLNYNQIFKLLDSCLQQKFEILSSSMCPDEFGQLFDFIVKDKNMYFYHFHLIEIDGKYLLIENSSTIGTKKNIDKQLHRLMKNIKTIKTKHI